MLDILGLPEESLMKRMGKPVRIEASEYGFQWYVYCKDYKKYLLAGMDSGIVAAAYTNSNRLTYQGVGSGMTKNTVRAKLGSPLTYVQKGKVVYILSDTGQRDYFAVGEHIAVVFYDMIQGGGVASVLLIPRALEADALIMRRPLSAGALAAYGRISADLVNAARARAGLGRLSADAKLGMLALARSADIRDRIRCSRDIPDGQCPLDLARASGIRFKELGENTAYGNHNAIFAHESIMNSTEHRNNILKKIYRKLGTGAAYGGTRYVILAQEFVR